MGLPKGRNKRVRRTNLSGMESRSEMLRKLPAPVVEFLEAKGAAFKALWEKRLRRRLDNADGKRFLKMVEDYHRTEEPA